MNHKAQGIIIEIIMFSMVIFLSIAMFFLLTASENVKEQNIEKSLDAELGPVAGEAAITYLLSQKIDEGLDKEKYNTSFSNVIRSYFSTDSDVTINGESFGRSEVESDIRSYLTYEYPKATSNIGSKIHYPDTRAVINISSADNYIVERKGSTTSSTNGRYFSRNLATSEGTVEVLLWIRR